MRLDQRALCQLGANGPLNVRLIEHIAGGPARGAAARVGWELQQELTIGRFEFIVWGRARVGQDHVSQSKLLEQAHDLMIEMGRAGQGIDFGLLVEGDRGHALLSQQRGEHRPDGA